MWVYDQTHFVWMSGNENSGMHSDVYGTSPGVLDSSNIPGSYYNGISFLDNQGLMNMFGGHGFTGGSGNKNTMWQIGFGHECFGKSICKNPINEVCSGHGKCINWNECFCDEGYVGNECSFPICFGKNSTNPLVCSGHGNCTSPANCECHTGYWGTQCQWECQTASILSTRFNMDATRIWTSWNMQK